MIALLVSFLLAPSGAQAAGKVRLNEITGAPASTTLPSSHPAEASKPIKLTLQEAIEAGVQGATLVLKNENNTRITGADLLKAYGNFMPNLALTGQYGIANGSTVQSFNAGVQTSNYQGANYSVSSTLNLFNGFGDVAAYNAAHSRDQSSGLTLARARQQIALDVTQAYLQSILNNELTDIALKNLNVSRERLKLLQAQRSVGSANSADVYRQSTEAASEEANWIVARNRAQISQLQLLQRLRMDARSEYELENPELNSAPSAKPLASEQALIAHALTARRDLTAQRETAKAAQSDVTYARRTYFPTLDLVGAFGGAGRYYNSNSINGETQMPASQSPLFNQVGSITDTTLMLNLNYEIFDRFTTTDNFRRAQAFSDDSQIDLDDLTNQVIVEVREGYSDYQAAVAQVEVSETGLEAATKAFQLITGRYKVGASSFIDLATSQAEQAQAEATRAQALVNLKLREQALNFVTGEDPVDFAR